MKRADPHAAHRLLEHALDARAHLSGGLVGEGHGENGVRRHPLHTHEPGDAVRKHPGLAGTGAGQHQQRPGAGGHGLALGGVEIGEQGGHIHGGIITFRVLARPGLHAVRS